MLAGMDLKDLDIKFVDGPKSAPGTVVQKVTVTMTSKTTGKTTPGPVTDILVWEFDESHKVKYGKIYFGAPDNLAGDLGKFLQSVTGERWMVTVSNEAGQPTLAEQRAKAQADEQAELADHPLVKAVMETFPGAEIKKVRHPDDD